MFRCLSTCVSLTIRALVLEERRKLGYLGSFRVLPFLGRRMTRSSCCEVRGSALSFNFIKLGRVLSSLFKTNVRSTSTGGFNMGYVRCVGSETGRLGSRAKLE